MRQKFISHWHHNMQFFNKEHYFRTFKNGYTPKPLFCFRSYKEAKQKKKTSEIRNLG